MKIIVERDRLKGALKLVASQTKGRKIPILTHVLLDAGGSKLRIVGHALSSCSQVTIPAEVHSKGSIAIPCDGLNNIVSGLSVGAQVSIEGDEKIGKIKCGRSAYQFSLLPPADFPDVLQLIEPVDVTITAAQAKALFDQPASCISKEESRHYLKGIYLHLRDGHLCAAATDGHTLARISVDGIQPPGFEGVIIPTDACAEIVRIAGENESTLQITRDLVALSSGERLFVTKLVDGTFPDIERVIPQAHAAPITLDCKELDAALARIVAAQDTESKGDVIRLSWPDNPQAMTITLRSGTAEGNEEVECDIVGDRPAGEVGLQCHYLRQLIEVTGGDTIRLRISGPGDPIRIENPQTDSVVAVCMPCRF